MELKSLRRKDGDSVFDEVVESEYSAENADSVSTPASVSPDHEEPDAADTGGADVGPNPDDNQDAVPEDVIPRRKVLRRVGFSVVIAGLIAVCALAGFLGWKVKQASEVSAAGQAALATAQTYAVILTSVDTTDIDRNFREVLDGATGEFKDMYSQSAAQLRQVLIDNKAMSRGTVVDAAIKSATETKVEVLVFVDQSISNTVNPDPRIDRSRVRMTMEFVDGRWLASNIDII